MIGMNAQITSQLTSEEICEHVRKVLAVFEHDGNSRVGNVAIDPALFAQLRNQIICQVVATCGRPIAKLEQEQIAEAQKAMRAAMGTARRQEHGGSVIIEDSPFNPNRPL